MLPALRTRMFCSLKKKAENGQSRNPNKCVYMTYLKASHFYWMTENYWVAVMCRMHSLRNYSPCTITAGTVMKNHLVQFLHRPFFFFFRISLGGIIPYISKRKKIYLTTLNSGFSNWAQVDQHELSDLKFQIFEHP